MIVPMKKMSLIVMDKEREASLQKLREAGVVHLKKKNVSSKLLGELFDRHTKNLWALGFLSKYETKGEAPAVGFSGDIISYIQTLISEKEKLQEQLVHLTGEKRQVVQWGEFDPKDLAFLNEKGIKLFLYLLPRQIYNRIGNDAKILIVSKDNQWVKALSLDEEIKDMRSISVPENPLSVIDERLDQVSGRLTEIEKEFTGLAFEKKKIIADDGHVLEQIEFEAARVGMETLEDAPQHLTISWFSGYVPGEKIDVVKALAEANSWTMTWSDPSPDDTETPPTLLKNKPAIRIIEPLFKMLGTLPGYWEYDISFSYMVFLCLFFAMILGDAVYGLFLLSIGIAIGILSKKKSGQFADVAKLLILLSSCTVAWGAMTGSWFAIPVASLPPALRMLIIQPFNNVGPLAQFPQFLQKLYILPETLPADHMKTQWNIQFLCFTIGMVQLVWARIKNIKKLLPSLTAFAQAGWLIVVFAIYFLVLFILLKVELPPFVPYLIGTGIALNFLFSEQKGGNFLKNIGKAFANFFPILLKTIGCFGDIISYIRLFAVGMAGSIIVQTVNSMAIPADGFGRFGIGFILKILTMVLILGFAHSLHLAINALSVIVHGLRLNLLEYAGNHLEIGWSGYEYKPFALKQKK